MDFDKPLSEEDLYELADKMSEEQVSDLFTIKQGKEIAELKDFYKENLPQGKEIFGQMSTQGYLEQEITITTSWGEVKMMLRTLSNWMYDEAEQKTRKPDEYISRYQKRYAMRLNAWSVQSFNESPIPGAGASLSVSYFKAFSDNDIKKMMIQRADKIEDWLEALPPPIYSMINFHRLAWEGAILEVLKHVGANKSEALKNSTASQQKG